MTMKRRLYHTCAGRMQGVKVGSRSDRGAERVRWWLAAECDRTRSGPIGLLVRSSVNIPPN